MAIDPLPKENEAVSGNPGGTYFAIGALVVLLVLVAIYFFVVHVPEISKPDVAPVTEATRPNAPASH